MLGESRRDLARQRQAVIAANPELRERELAKLADYARRWPPPCANGVWGNRRPPWPPRPG